MLSNIISQAGRNRIKGYETLRLAVYMPTPQDVPTIGWGHTGKDVRMDSPSITTDMAEKLFEHDCMVVEVGIDRATQTSEFFNQNQIDALGCLIFNVGVGAFLGSQLLRAILHNDAAAIKTNWLDWDHQGRRELAGLKRRRQEEWELYSGEKV